MAGGILAFYLENEHFEMVNEVIETLETKDLDITVNLVDTSGRIIMNLKTKNKTLEFSTANLQNGVYTVVASIGNQKTSTNLVVNH